MAEGNAGPERPASLARPPVILEGHPLYRNRRRCGLLVALGLIFAVLAAPALAAAAETGLILLGQASEVVPLPLAVEPLGDDVVAVSGTTVGGEQPQGALVFRPAATAPPATAPGGIPAGPPPSPSIGAASCAGVAVGTDDDPQALIDSRPEGTTFCFSAGVHRLSQDLRPKPGQTFVGLRGAVLNGSQVLSQFRKAGSAWVADGVTQTFYLHGECETEGYEGCRDGFDVRIDDTPLWQVDTPQAVGPGTFHRNAETGVLTLGDDPTGRRVEATLAWHAFLGKTRDGQPAPGVTVRGFVVEKFGGMAQRGAIDSDRAEGWLIEGNEVRHNHGAGIASWTAGVVRGNFVHHNGQIGLVGGGSGVLVEGNEIAHNNTQGFDVGWEAGGSKWWDTTDLTVRGNYSHDNAGFGLWTDFNNFRTVYEGNVVADNANGGIFHEISYDATITGNLVSGNGFDGQTWGYGAGIIVAHSPSVTVTGNVVEDNFNGISLIQQDRGAGSRGPWELQDVEVRDNRVRMEVGATGVYSDTGDPAVFDRRLVFEGNDYVSPNPEPFRGREGTLTFPEWRQQGNDQGGTLTQP